MAAQVLESQIQREGLLQAGGQRVSLLNVLIQRRKEDKKGFSSKTGQLGLYISLAASQLQPQFECWF